MKLAEYIELKTGEGYSLTRAVEELSDTLGVTSRSVWGWYKQQKAPQLVELLLSVLVEATPEQRARWFAERG